MIPVDQTTFGMPHGNCLSACVASLLHLPITQVPAFCDKPDIDWWKRLLEWLHERGWYGLMLNPPAGGKPPRGYHIRSGKSPRGDFLHSVVARGDEIVHDPHPSRAGLESFEDFIVLVPLDPGQFADLADVLSSHSG
jgi:hypothetical protein